MLAIILISSLLISAHCIPLDGDQPKLEEPKQPQPINNEDAQKPIEPAKDIEQPQPAEEPVVGGALLPGDVSGSPDANPANQPGTADLDTDATFWGWGYRRPYYGWRSYYSPYRRYGWGRGYGGWGRGWGWGGYYW